jgi:hypothetical protein
MTGTAQNNLEKDILYLLNSSFSKRQVEYLIVINYLGSYIKYFLFMKLLTYLTNQRAFILVT